MDLIAEIRRPHLVSKERLSAIARDLNLSRPTVRKHCRTRCEPSYRRPRTGRASTVILGSNHYVRSGSVSSIRLRRRAATPLKDAPCRSAVDFSPSLTGAAPVCRRAARRGGGTDAFSRPEERSPSGGSGAHASTAGRSFQGVPLHTTGLTWISSLRSQAMAQVCNAPRHRPRPCSSISALFQ
jgi:hypothetical protein